MINRHLVMWLKADVKESTEVFTATTEVLAAALRIIVRFLKN